MLTAIHERGVRRFAHVKEDLKEPLGSWSATEFETLPSAEIHSGKKPSGVFSPCYWVDAYSYSATVSGEGKCRREKYHLLVNGQLPNFCKAAGNLNYFHLSSMINHTRDDIRNLKDNFISIWKGLKSIETKKLESILPGCHRSWNPQHGLIHLAAKRYSLVMYATIPTKWIPVPPHTPRLPLGQFPHWSYRVNRWSQLVIEGSGSITGLWEVE